jgi:predicted dehydrogenase
MMRIAISGMGLRSSHVLTSFKRQMPEVEFVGFFDPQPTFLDDLDPDIPQFDDIDTMLADTQPDLFFIGSPNEFHLDHLKSGFNAGVRMFCEKPVVTTIDDTLELAALLAKHGMDRVIVGLVLRYSHHMVDLRAQIAAGALGDITSMEASEHIAPYHGAFFMRDWRRKTTRTGGFMLEKCCHDLDLYNMITASRPKHVASFGSRRSYLPEHRPATNSEMEVYHVKKSVWDSTDDPFHSDGDIIDCQTAILEYESGASLAFHTNLNVPDEHRRFCIIGARGMAEGDFTRGYLHVTDARTSERTFDADYTTLGVGKGHYGADDLMVADIVAHLRDPNIPLPVSILDALEAGVAALALDQARAEKRVVDLTDVWSEIDAHGLRT